MNDGGPAFPKPASPEKYIDHCQEGMSLRDYFAAAAMQGLLYTEPRVEYGQQRRIYADQARKLAKAAYQLSDAMLDARKDR